MNRRSPESGMFKVADFPQALRLLEAERALHASSGDTDEVREREEQIATIKRVENGNASDADRKRADEIIDALMRHRAKKSRAA